MVVIPLSHNLPIYKSSHIYYDTAIIRVAHFLSQRFGEITIIDVGANVGDSAVSLLSSVDCRVIAVEGNSHFLPYLEYNLRNYSDRTVVVPSFIGSPGVISASISEAAGTASLKLGHGATITLKSLSSIVSDLSLESVHLIKIDTDGFDIEVIASCIDFLSAEKPALFFEFDPALFTRVSADGWGIFTILRDAGYSGGIIYTNTGVYLRSFALNDRRMADELRMFINSAGTSNYVDIVIFAEHTKAIQFGLSELAFFGQRETMKN